MLIRRIVAAVAVPVALLALAAPAAAHPFGPPSTARISADDATVSLSWLAAEDDWVALGQSLGAFDDPTETLTGEQKLQRSPAVRDYLLERITVRQDGRPCDAGLATLAELLTKGARLTFDCPAPVVDVEVTLDVLTDLNEAYRTVLTVEEAPVLFTAERNTQQVRLAGGGTGVGGTVVAVAVGTGAAALLGVGVLVMRRRSRS